MRTSAMLLLSLFLARPALAQIAPETSCETVTTTTTRCTTPAPPLPRLAPLPDECDECDDVAPGPRLQAIAPPPPGFRLVPQADGTLAYERTRKTASGGVWGTGLALWLVASAGTGIASVRSGYYGLGFFPIAGAIGSTFAAGFEHHAGATVGYAFGTIAQVAGFVTFLVGLTAGPKRIERLPIQIAPLASRDGGGATLSFRF